MAGWGLLGGLGAGMSQVGQNMYEQAKLDRINEFRMQMQQGQQDFTAQENAANRQQRADLQADQQRFTAEQNQIQANQNIELAKEKTKAAQAKGIKPDWQKVEMVDGSVVFVDPNTGEQRFVSSKPPLNTQPLPGVSVPPPDFHNQSTVSQPSGGTTSQQTKTRELNPRANNSWFQSRN